MSSKQWEGGKGSQRRGDNDEQYRSNWDRIFGGIDYEDEALKQSLYHSKQSKGRLEQGKNIPVISPDTLLDPKNPKS